MVQKLTKSSIVNPLIKELQTLSSPIETGQIDSVSWTDSLIRLLRLETFSTATNSSPLIQREHTSHTLSVATLLLRAGAARCRTLAAQQKPGEADQLLTDAEAMTSLVALIDSGYGLAQSNWHGELTLIVGKKAIIAETDEPWMARRHDLEGW